MRYVKVENNIPTDYSLGELFTDFPNAVVYKNSQMPNQELLANYNVYPLITEPQPPLTDDEVAEESTPVFFQGEWHQKWEVRKKTNEEIQVDIDDNINNSQFDEDSNNTFFSNKEVQEHRYAICKSCNFFTSYKTCQKCGCIVPLKIRVSSAQCPLDKW